MGQFDRQIQTALRLIKQSGQQITWTQTPNSIPDSSKPWLVVPGTPVVHTPYVAFLPYTQKGIPRGQREFNSALDQGEAQVGIYYGYMGAQDFIPNLKDTVSRNGVFLDIASIDVLAPNGQNILYTISFNG